VLSSGDSNLIHLLDDECSSLIGLAKLCGVFDIDSLTGESVSQTTLSMYLVIQSALRLRQLPPTLIKSLRRVIIAHMRCPSEAIINRAMITFAYRKAVKHLRLEIGHHVVVGKTF
jgi:hypothetical protein